MLRGVAQERHPIIQYSRPVATYDVPCGSENYYVLVYSSGGVWGSTLPRTVRSLPVVVGNLKEVVFPSARHLSLSIEVTLNGIGAAACCN